MSIATTEQTAPVAAPTSTLDRVNGSAGFPSVNLMPPEILVKRQTTKAAWIAAAVVVASAVAVGGTYTFSAMQLESAKAEFQQVDAQSAVLRAEIGKLAYVPLRIARLEGVQNAKATAMRQDVLWHKFFGDISMSFPKDVWLKSMQFQLGGASPDPLAPSSIGTVTVEGNSKTFPDVALWLEHLDNTSAFKHTLYSNMAKTVDDSKKTSVSFSSTAVIVPDALSHRYDKAAEKK